MNSEINNWLHVILDIGNVHVDKILTFEIQV